MSKFITFDGVNHFNSQIVKKISFEDKMRISAGNEYAYCEVFIDGELFYTTLDYKYYDEDGEIEGRLDRFQEEVHRLKSLITK